MIDQKPVIKENDITKITPSKIVGEIE